MNSTTVNHSFNSTVQSIDEISLSLMKYQTIAFILWVLCGLLNTLAASLTIATIIFWKPLHTDTQILAANLAFAEGIGGITLAMAGCYHLFNIVNYLPETTTQMNCYFKVGIHYYSLDVSAFFYLAISLDRFVAAVFPTYYINRPKRYSIYLSILFWIVPSLLFVCSYFDLSDSTYIPVCLVRAAVGNTFYSIYIYSLLAVSMLSVLTYILTMVILKYQMTKFASDNVNVADIKRRMRNKATRALAFSAILHFVTFTASAFGSILIANYVYRGTTYGPYLGLMYFLGGINCLAFYLVCQKQFYTGLLVLLRQVKMKMKLTKSGTQLQKLGPQRISP